MFCPKICPSQSRKSSHSGKGEEGNKGPFFGVLQCISLKQVCTFIPHPNTSYSKSGRNERSKENLSESIILKQISGGVIQCRLEISWSKVCIFSPVQGLQMSAIEILECENDGSEPFGCLDFIIMNHVKTMSLAGVSSVLRLGVFPVLFLFVVISNL